MAKCDLNKVDFIPFAQFKKHEKYPWRSVTFSKVTGLTNCFLNCANVTKSRNALLLQM